MILFIMKSLIGINNGNYILTFGLFNLDTSYVYSLIQKWKLQRKQI